jgi:hypothetical protein
MHSIDAHEASVGASLAKIVADAGYRGHNASKEKAFKVYVVGQLPLLSVSQTVCATGESLRSANK